METHRTGKGVGPVVAHNPFSLAHARMELPSRNGGLQAEMRGKERERERETKTDHGFLVFSRESKGKGMLDNNGPRSHTHSGERERAREERHRLTEEPRPAVKDKHTKLLEEITHVHIQTQREAAGDDQAPRTAQADGWGCDDIPMFMPWCMLYDEP